MASPLRASAVAVAMLSALPATVFGATDSWLTPASGNWTDGTKWSGGVPNGATVDAVIGASGGNYTVGLSSNITLSSLTLGDALATLNQTTGNLTVSGIVDVVNSTWNLGGTVNNATIQSSGTGRVILGLPTVHLNGVTLNTSVDTPGNRDVKITGGLTINAAISMKNTETFSFADGSSLGGNGTITVNGLSGYPGYKTTFSNTTIGGGITLQTGNAGGLASQIVLSHSGNNGTISVGTTNGSLVIFSAVSAVQNLGTISAMANGANITITGSADDFINNGTLSTSNGSLLRVGANIINNSNINVASGGYLYVSSNITNNGNISVTNGGFLSVPGNITGSGKIALDGGYLLVQNTTLPSFGFTQANGSAVILINTLTTSQTTYDLGTTPLGHLDLGYGAKISNVTLVSSNGTPQVFATPTIVTPAANKTTFSNVTLATDLTLLPGSYLQVTDALGMSNNSIHLAGSVTSSANITGAATLVLPSFSGGGRIVFDGSGQLYANFVSLSANVPANVTIQTGSGGGSVIGVVDLYGTISAQTPGSTILVHGLTFGVNVSPGGLLQAVNGGSIVAASWLNDSGQVNIGAGSAITVNQVFQQLAGGSVTGPGVLYASSLTGAVSTSGTIVITSVVVGQTANALSSLTLAGSVGNWTAKLDMGVGTVQIQSATGDLSTLSDQLRQGYNGGGWNGTGGITSNAVLASIGTSMPEGIALMTGADYFAATGDSTFNTESYASTDSLLKIALLGDANFDGKVDLTDLATVYNNYGMTSFSWTHGNFDYSTTIDLPDLLDVLAPFGYYPTTESVALSDAQALLAAAPEPGSLALMGLAGVVMMRRRVGRAQGFQSH